MIPENARVWLAVGRVLELGYDAVAVPGVSGGVFADVQFEPTGEKETCYVGMGYAGTECGEWWPVSVGDKVLVAMPYGEAGWGPVIVSRFWNSSALPPTPTDPDWAASAGTREPPTDAIIRMKKGSAYKLRADDANIEITVDSTGAISIATRGAGDVLVEALGSGKVKLGVAATAQAVALSPLVEAAIKAAVDAAVAGHGHMYAPGPGTPVMTTGGIKAPPAIPYITTVNSTAAKKTEAT